MKSVLLGVTNLHRSQVRQRKKERKEKGKKILSRLKTTGEQLREEKRQLYRRKEVVGDINSTKSKDWRCGIKFCEIKGTRDALVCFECGTLRKT